MAANAGMLGDRAAFLSTFGAWQDERSDEEIIAKIYKSRTIGEDERAW